MGERRVNGWVQRAIHVGVYSERNSVAHELRKREQLDALRALRYPSPPEFRNKAGSRLASANDRVQFAERMIQTGSEILSTLQKLEGRATRYPTLDRFTRTFYKGLGRRAAATLSLPVKREPDMKRAMATPQHRQDKDRQTTNKSNSHSTITPALLEAADEYLRRAQADCSVVNDRRENAPPPLTHLAEDNLRLAEKLAQQVRNEFSSNTDNTESAVDCATLIERLEGFDTNTNEALRRELQGKFNNLMAHLDLQKDRPDHWLDSEAAFRLAYQAVKDALSAPWENADGARAAAALTELTHPLFDLGKLMNRQAKTDDTRGGVQPTTIEDARSILHALSSLRRGSEIIQRVTIWKHYPPTIQKRGLTGQEQAMRVLLQSSKAMADGGASLNKETSMLLQAAQRAALKLCEDPDAVLTTGERVPYDAVRNRFLEAGKGSPLQYASDRLSELTDRWLPNAVKARNAKSEGTSSALRTLFRRASPARGRSGKTPLDLKTLKLAAQTSTAYGVDPPKTAKQIDQYIINSTQALKSAVMALAEHAPDQETWRLLAYISSGKVAEEKMKADQLRPEHCILGDLEADDSPDNAYAEITRIEEELAQLNNKIGIGTSHRDTSSAPRPLAIPLHPLLARPLKGENIIDVTLLLARRMEAMGLEESHPAREAVEHAVREVRRLADLLDISEPSVATLEDIYRYLAPLIEQLQLRGKVRLTASGVAGVSGKPLSVSIRLAEELLTAYQLKHAGALAAISIAPRIRLEWQGSEGRVIEISMSTVGFEIFIGEEKRKSGAAGGGVRLGFGNEEARVTVLAEKTRVAEGSVQNGVKFMIPRSANKEYSDDEMRREARQLFDLAFRMFVDEKGEVRRMDPAHASNDASVDGIPNNVAAILALCPHVSIAVVGGMSETNRRSETSAVSAIRTTHDATVAPSRGTKNMRSTRAVAITELTGTTNVERNNFFHGGQVLVSAGAAPTATIGSNDGTRVDLTERLSTAGKAMQVQHKIVGSDARLRLVTVDGKTDPVNTRRDVEHTNFSTLLASINASRERWIQVGIDHLFTTPDYKQFADLPDDEKRLIVESNLTAMLEELKQREISEDGARVLRNVFAESYRLTDGAGARYDTLRDTQTQLESRIETLEKSLHENGMETLEKFLHENDDREARARNKGQWDAANLHLRQARQERKRIVDAQNMLLQDNGSWLPWKITASERTLETSQAGFDFFLKFGRSRTADGQRPVKSWPV
jgi:hypothetical protein